MQKGRVVILRQALGILFTTDSAAVVRAIEMNCDLCLKVQMLTEFMILILKGNKTQKNLQNLPIQTL